ncbi:protein LURP-one-related 5-like [Panicum miliaceum]|uniref:Protein LURP-one-related 5-like n=1 Tax=Panicum miliaceum TaxID=4540 RepID=A0A3L6PIB9_PANMI|nr:protein LURP-one-related 5-like [Panicum miliaceum]
MHHPVPPRSSPSNIATGKRVHPSDADALHHSCPAAADDDPKPALYTVWKRSSMGFQGTDGFSVYDAAGALAFRLDNYSRRRKLFAGELLLMDGQGAPLLALRPQILSMRDQWNCYRASEEAGDKSSSRRQHLFSMRKCSLVKRNDEAEVHISGCTTSSDHDSQAPSFRVQGSFWRRSCKILKGNGEEVARITRKKAGAVSETVTLGEDVFSLTIMPNVDRSMIMAFVVILDRICQKPYKLLMCSS